MKKTPLSDTHRAMGAKMAAFAGYDMPIVYTDIRSEHQAVREQVGVFDVSHMGEFIIRGKEALDLIQKVTSNDASKLAIGDAQYSCLPNHSGGIVDDLLVYRLDEDQCSEGEQAFMLVVNAANIEKDWDWISQHNSFDTKMINISDHTGLLAVQGPQAKEAVQALTEVDLDSIPYYKFKKGTVAGLENVLISATGYTGSGGFELYVNSKDSVSLWEAILNGETQVKPIGLGARDTLRLEMGYCLYGNDITDSTSPIEAGLSWITKLKKGEFNSVDIFRAQKAAGVSRRLVGFTAEGRRVPRQGYPIELADGTIIGSVTSGTLSPSLDIPIGMGWVAKEHSKAGTELMIDAGRRKINATVVKVPFYKP